MIDLRPKKLDTGFMRIALTLFIVTLVVGALLGVVDALTRDTIAENREKAYLEAQQAIFPDAQFIELAQDIDDIENICIAMTDDETGMGGKLGYTILVNTVGRNGTIQLLVGTDLDGTVQRVIVLESAENAAGVKIDTEAFLNQYIGKVKGITIGDGTKNTVLAITTGTISSRAVTEGINKALDALSHLGDGVEQPTEEVTAP